MIVDKKKPKAKPENKRVRPSAPENKRSAPPAAKVPWSARLAVFRERMRVRFSGARKVASIGFATTLVIGAGAGLVAVGQLVERHVRTSPAFAIKDIEVQGATRLSHEEVVHAAGLAFGQNAFLVGPARAKDNLLHEPWIATASVQRRLPASYSIQITERRALALLALDQLYVVGEDGSAFKQLGPGDPADLPIITGIDPEDVQRDKRGSAGSLVDAVSLLHDYQDAGLWRREPVLEIHVEDDGSLSVYVGTDSLYVRLGHAPFRTKLNRLRAVLSELSSKKTRAAYVYLDNERRPDRVTVRLR